MTYDIDTKDASCGNMRQNLCYPLTEKIEMKEGKKWSIYAQYDHFYMIYMGI